MRSESLDFALETKDSRHPAIVALGVISNNIKEISEKDGKRIFTGSFTHDISGERGQVYVKYPEAETSDGNSFEISINLGTEFDWAELGIAGSLSEGFSTGIWRNFKHEHEITDQHFDYERGFAMEMYILVFQYLQRLSDLSGKSFLHNAVMSNRNDATEELRARWLEKFGKCLSDNGYQASDSKKVWSKTYAPSD